MKPVTPTTIHGNGLYNHFTGRKKWTITCGACGHTWKEKVPIHEPSSAICPCCKAQNKWSIVAFDAAYNKRSTNT